MTSLLDKWRLLQAIVAATDLSPTAKSVAVRLLDHANGSTGQCTPSYDTIARGIGLTRRRAIDGVKELEAAGWITVSRTTHAKAREAGKALSANHFAFDWSRLDHPPADAEDDTRASAGSDTTLVQDLTLASTG